MPETSLVFAQSGFPRPARLRAHCGGRCARERARHAALACLAALGLATLGYLGAGFALQFGGVGLLHDRPGFEGLVWEWSAARPHVGPGLGHGRVGGLGHDRRRRHDWPPTPWHSPICPGPSPRPRSRSSACAAGSRAGPLGCSGLLVGAVIYPARRQLDLGRRLAGQPWAPIWVSGHGLVDAGGAGLVHLLGAAVDVGRYSWFPSAPPRADAAAIRFRCRRIHLPLLALLGVGLLLIGSLAWTIVNPLLAAVYAVTCRASALNGFAGRGRRRAAVAAYTWLVAGSPIR